jgi:hypothetical protein
MSGSYAEFTFCRINFVGIILHHKSNKKGAKSKIKKIHILYHENQY